MAEYPYLPLFVTDYAAATDHLSDAEHGIYLRLLMLMWQSPDCRLPDDDEWLARRFRRDANAVRTHMRPIIDEFCQTQSGWIIQKRLQQEWRWRKSKSITNSRSAKSRWNKDNHISERNASTHSERNAPTLPYPTPKTEERKKEKTGKILLPDTWEPNASHFELANAKGLSGDAVADAVGEMRSWSLGNGEKRANWDWVFNNWLRRNSQKRMNGNGHGKSPRTVQDAAADLLSRVRGFDEPAPSGVRSGTRENAPGLLSKR